MADYRNMRPNTVIRADASVDAGLRSYMLRVYNLMAVGLVITAIASMATFSFAQNNDSFKIFLASPAVQIVVLFAPLAIVFFMSFKIHDINVSTARALFIAYATLIGVWLSTIYYVYSHESIAQVFFITAASFGGLSLYGYTTKRDLRPLGAFLIIGLFGLIIASLVFLFIPSSTTMDFAISVLGVVIFAGLTAYDTQMIKEMYYENDGDDTIGRKIVMGALSLYLDFINMFLFMLRLFANRN